MAAGSGSDTLATLIIIVSGLIGLVFAAYQAHVVNQVKFTSKRTRESNKARLVEEDSLSDSIDKKLADIHYAIEEGAKSFLNAEYKYMFIFISIFSVLLVVLLGLSSSNAKIVPEKPWLDGVFSAIAFVAGGLTSILSGYVGMRIAVFANVRTAIEARTGYTTAFNTAFRAGSVMGFSLCSMALLVLYFSIRLFTLAFNETSEVVRLYENIAAYGLGGSSIALFGRVGGGIYTKAADVGADLVGKVEANIPEDDPRNPGVIADNVGDNVGDVAGMGADLFGSFAEASCAALVISSTSLQLNTGFAHMSFPLLISASGILVCILTSFVATNISPCTSKETIEPVLKKQLLISTILETLVLIPIAFSFLPEKFSFITNPTVNGTWWKAYLCVVSGLWAGLIIGYITEYYTSNAYHPVQEVANSCETGAATNIIYGLALGYKSTIIPVLALAFAIYLSFRFCYLYGIALAALGMLSTLSIGLTIDAYGPISDNAGGIAEMAGLGDDVRERTDALDAAGNTTAAIGKGFAIGSAALVSLALFGAFVTRVAEIKGAQSVVDILKPLDFAGLLIGAMLPYAFSAMTMKSVGEAANQMVLEIRRQFREIEGLMSGEAEPDYRECVRISTDASLREMIAPGVLVMGTPLAMGFLFGVEAVMGVLAGGLVSGVQMAISASNTGGAWDNAKKYIEAGNLGGKGSPYHAAAVIGDTVGDPLKDTSGPSLNILMKLMAIISLVFAPFFVRYGDIFNLEESA